MDLASAVAEPVAILNTGNMKWHLAARFPGGPLLSPEACNLDDADPGDLIEYAATEIPSEGDWCQRCLGPVIATVASR